MSTTLNTPPARSRLLRVFSSRTGIAFIAVLLVIAGYLLWHKLHANSDSLDQYQIASVQRGDVEDLVTATGTLQPREYVDIGAQVSGQLKKIHVETGSVVTAGTLLAEIDPTVYLANVEARRASLRNQQATLVDREAQLTLAELQYARQQRLMEGDATTIESVQAAEATLRSAKAQIQALQAQIEQIQSTLLADEANLNYAKIYASMSGVVVSITARQGQTLNTNQSAPIILRIADLSTMTVQTQVSEADVSRLSPNMEAYFTTLGSRGKRWYGKLLKVEPTPTVTNNVVLYNALFDVPNEERNLLPQMTAQVFFVAASAKNTLYIPAAAANTKRGDRSANTGAHATDSTNKTSRTATAASKQPENSAEGAPKQHRKKSEDMTDEERQAFRARRSQREQDKVAAPAVNKIASAETKPTAGNNSASSATTDQTQVWAGVTQQQRREGGEAIVKVVNADGKIEERTIQIGITNRVHVQVLSGLKEGDQVVVARKPPPGAETAKSENGKRETNALQASGAGGRPR